MSSDIPGNDLLQALVKLLGSRRDDVRATHHRVLPVGDYLSDRW